MTIQHPNIQAVWLTEYSAHFCCGKRLRDSLRTRRGVFMLAPMTEKSTRARPEPAIMRSPMAPPESKDCCSARKPNAFSDAGAQWFCGVDIGVDRNECFICLCPIFIRSFCHRYVYYLAGLPTIALGRQRSEEHTSELQSRFDLVCRLLL